MTTYDTPEPIAISIEIVGDARVTASDRSDTTVVVRPRNGANSADVKAAEETVVEFSDGRLRVRIPKHWTRFTPFGGGESVDVTIEAPTGSRVEAHTDLGHLYGEGELGASRFKSAMGNIRLDHTGHLHASTGFGDVAVDRVQGDAEIRSGSGDIRVGVVDGSVVVKNANGLTTVDESAGDLRVKNANGDILVGSAHASVTTRTANGDIRIGDVRHGTVVMETAAGELEVGVHEGTAAWLDVSSRFGTVRNALDAAQGPAPTDDTVEIRARTSAGDIVITRALDLREGSGR